MELGKKIVKIRKDNNLTQEDLAEMYYVSRQTISSWENSKSYPDLDILIKISNDFSISLDVLLKGDEKMVTNISKSQKDSKRYKNILTIISIGFILILILFGIYSISYYSSKDKVENKFNASLKANNFKKNRDGYYSYKYKDNIIYGVPNQKMPSLFDFSLDFHAKYIYLDIFNIDGTYATGTWNYYNDYDLTLYNKNDIVISELNSKKDNIEDINIFCKMLGITEKELQEIIYKGNDLYKEFYN